MNEITAHESRLASQKQNFQCILVIIQCMRFLLEQGVLIVKKLVIMQPTAWNLNGKGVSAVLMDQRITSSETLLRRQDEVEDQSIDNWETTQFVDQQEEDIQSDSIIDFDQFRSETEEQNAGPMKRRR